MNRNQLRIVANLATNMNVFKATDRNILSTHESSSDRIITVIQTRKTIKGLSPNQAELFEQAVKCVEKGVFKAAHVMAWAAFMDFLEEKITEDNLLHLHTLYPKWDKLSTVEDLRETVAEYQLIEAARRLSILRKGEEKILKGHLAKRNECAHPSNYNPGMNETLGYVDELLKRIEKIQSRPCKSTP